MRFTATLLLLTCGTAAFAQAADESGSVEAQAPGRIQADAIPVEQGPFDFDQSEQIARKQMRERMAELRLLLNFETLSAANRNSFIRYSIQPTPRCIDSTPEPPADGKQPKPPLASGVRETACAVLESMRLQLLILDRLRNIDGRMKALERSVSPQAK